MESILVGVDGSKGSQHALEWALNAARAWGATVQAVHVAPRMDIPAYVAGRAGGVPGPTVEVRLAHGEQVLDEVIQAAAPPADIVLEREVVLAEHPAEALVARSRDVDLIVVGSRGVGGFRGVLLGSVSQRCAAHAACPVVVVPPTAD